MTATRRNPDPTSSAETGARLALTREALGHTQVMMAKLMGSATYGQAWENYESGRRRMSINHAIKLHQTCGLTLEWIYLGQMHNLPPNLRKKIQKLLLRA
jgi:DNA-binding XRE family transcriptional regulator